jgi:hypothetical protein
MKDTKSILLVLLSAGLIATWVFFIAEKSKPKTAATEKIIISNEAEIKKVQDSLQNVYEGTVNRLGAELDSAKNTAGQLQGELNARLNEILQLKYDIADLLRKTYPRKEDLVLAGQKTTRLQQLVSGLQSKNNNTVADNREKSQPETVVPDISKEIIQPAEKTETVPNFTATNLKFIPVATVDEKEVETTTSAEINKLLVSFTVQNNTADFPNAEVFAVVTQPDGKVVQEAWESASMETRNGRKKYTRKVRFGYQRGETKQLQFSISPDDYERGSYTLQVYHNGYLIGQTVKTLN